MIKALLFDMDGVLCDSEDISISVGIEYFASIGVKAGHDSFRNSLGKGEKGFFDTTAEALGSPSGYSYDEASEFFRRRYPVLAEGRQIAMPGALDLVRRARKAGLLTAVASSAPAWKVMENLRAAGFGLEDFDFIASGEDIRRNKPAPDIYRLCLIKLGIDGDEAVVFEDSVSGIISGRSALCRVVALMTTTDGESAGKAGADAVISDLSVIPPFGSAGELDHIIDSFGGKEEGVAYGAVEIIPRKRRESRESIVGKLRKAASDARRNGYAPYSSFKVGAALVSAATGRIYSGCNVENSSYGATICAERNAITTAVAAEGTLGIDILVVFSDDDPPAPPCALCLQVMAEFARPETEIILFSEKGAESHFTFAELLPNPFIFPTMRR